MCGIGGIRRMGTTPIDIGALQQLGCALESRGNDACGVVFQQADGHIHTLKNDVQPWKFLSSARFNDFVEKHLQEDTRTVLVHTRLATKGTPRVNANNHPLFSGCSAVIHNGIISNDDYLFDNMKLERKAETDSDIIRAILDREGLTKKGVRELNRMVGSAAIAAVHPRYPGMLLLGRSGSPVIVAERDDFLVFASEKQCIHRACRPHTEKWGIPFAKQSYDISFTPMPDDTIWLIGEEGVLWHDKFRVVASVYNPPNYNRVREDYTGRQERFRPAEPAASKTGTTPTTASSSHSEVTVQEDGETYDRTTGTYTIYCPKAACRQEVVLTRDEWEKGLGSWMCPKCKTYLNVQPNSVN